MSDIKSSVIYAPGGAAQRHSPRVRRGLRRADISPRTVARFHEKYQSGDAVGCWRWTGGCYPAGYGMVYLGRYADGRQHTEYAHRVAFVLAFGDIPAADPRPVVMHACDNTGCVNPAHLRLGTQSENLLDASVKGRLPKTRRRNRKLGKAA